MRLRNGDHLMYCLNIHPSETLAEVREAVDRYSVCVKARVCPDRAFALGLRLSRRAADELLPRADAFGSFLEERGMYAVSVNGFPWGEFSRGRVKEKVYLPDWSDSERLAYTVALMRILASILPPGETGTVSTLPLCYGRRDDPRAMRNLLLAGEAAGEIEAKTGRSVVLSLEPEPGCRLDTLGSVVSFFRGLRSRGYGGRRIGICLDCCHAAVEFESPAEWLRVLGDEGVPVPKVQLSAAPVAWAGGRDTGLSAFAEERYLHQTRIRASCGILRYRDLDEALLRPAPGEWRTHFHVPLTWRSAENGTTVDCLDDDFFGLLRSVGGRHIEVETYSFDVLPGARPPVEVSITAELAWALSRLEVGRADAP